jgi:hypothetical protein
VPCWFEGCYETEDILLVVATTVAFLGPFLVVFRAFNVEEAASPCDLKAYPLVLRGHSHSWSRNDEITSAFNAIWAC